jgi:hypothetical protein
MNARRLIPVYNLKDGPVYRTLGHNFGEPAVLYAKANFCAKDMQLVL